jgi:hypothetical protein
MVMSREAWLADFGEELVADGAVVFETKGSWLIDRCVVAVSDDDDGAVVSGRVFEEPEDMLLPQARALQFHYRLREDEPDVAADDVVRWINRRAAI